MSPIAEHPPSTWLLLGHKAGDNNQVLALIEGLGWSAVEKRIRYRDWELAANLLLRVTLAGIDVAGSDALEAPWPDLVITSGRRNEPVARWIKKQSGGRTKLVHVGRPWAHPRLWDLVVTTPQYRVPAGPNVLTNALPLHRLTRARLDAAAGEWTPRLNGLARPWVAVLVGGDSGPYVFDEEKAERLGREAARMARAAGGSVLITTSARTSAEAVAALVGAIDAPSHVFKWGDDPDANPYLGYLALADEIVVTGESMSMLTEACFTGRPVHVFDLGEDDAPWWRQAGAFRWKPLSHRVGTALGPARMARDVRRIQERLIEEGRAVRLGETSGVTAPPPPSRDLDRAIERVRALFQAAGSASGS